MSIKLTNKAVVWGYFSQFFSIGSGIIILPLILSKLSPNEIGMNYLMLTVGSMVSLFDFGFAPQFGRNITYIFSGAQILKKEGIEINSGNKDINYRLLATMIYTAKSVYRILSIIVLFVMLTFGSFYIYKVTNGFSNVPHALFIWITYSISTFFNIYFTYYSSLLTGKGLILESKKAMVYSKIVYIFLTATMLLGGSGLIGISLANLISPFVSRYISYHYFFTQNLKDRIHALEITKQEKTVLFKIIWHNASKLGLVYIGAYAITKLSMFLAGLYLPLKDVASYGLMIQFGTLISTVSGTFFVLNEPRFTELKITRNHTLLLKAFSLSMGVYYFLFALGGLFLLLTGPWFLLLVKSTTYLPPTYVIILYILIMLLEGNHSFFATMIVIGNTVPFMWLSLITGGLITIGSYLSLEFTSLGIFGLILVQGLVQLSYNNWKWPHFICKEFKISFISFLQLSFSELYTAFKNGRSKYRLLSNR